jgi:hypothetical protein
VSIIYSGQTIVNTTTDGSSASALLNGLVNILQSVGWTVVQNGTSSGIWRLRTVQTPQGLQGDLWLRLPIAPATQLALDASSLAATSYNAPSGQCSADANMPTGAGYTYQVIAGAYYFYLFRAVVPCPSSQSFVYSVPYIPAFLQGLVSSLVVSVFPYTVNQSICNQGLFATGGSNAFAYLNGVGATATAKWNLLGLSSFSKPVWFDGSCEFYEPRVQAYATANGLNAGSLMTCGYQWDALVFNYPIQRGSIIAVDGFSWYALTENTDPGLLVLVS